VTCAEESVAPRSDCSPTDELIRDQRSVVSTAQSIQVHSRAVMVPFSWVIYGAYWFLRWHPGSII